MQQNTQKLNEMPVTSAAKATIIVVLNEKRIPSLS
jgi:hypothetical protein